MEISQRIYNGARAKEVLDNEAFQQAWNDITAEITEQWRQSPARDSEGREKLYQLLRLCEKLKQQFQTTLETGKLAEMELKHQRSLLERAKDAMS